MLASYTANLAAFLTNDMKPSAINSAEDLASQSKVKYGAIKSGSTIKFFQNSNFSTFQQMWAAMENNGESVEKTRITTSR
jgi:glutamate receptor, ionotropic, invertebrate